MSSIRVSDSWLLLGHLALRGLASRLSQELVSLISLLIEIGKVGNKHVVIDNLLVVKEHTSNLASKVAIPLLDDWEDTISNLLLSGIGILDLLEHFLKINQCLLLRLHRLVVLLLL